MGFLLRLLACVMIFSLFLFLFLHHSHRVDELKIDLPTLAEEIETMREKNAVMQYEIDRYESPLHLMELHRRPEFRHLKHPREDEVVIIER